MPHQHAKKALEQRQASPSIYTDIEWLTFPAEWRPCDVLPLSWVNGQPPYSILGTWWSDESALSDAEGRQWLVAGDIDDNAYNWTGLSVLLPCLCSQC